MVEDPARRADDDLYARRQLSLLWAVGTSAIDDRQSNPRVFGERAQHISHLPREFASRRQHEGLNLSLLRVATLQHRETEGQRLAGARLGLPDEIAPF